MKLNNSFQCSQWFAISLFLTPHQLVKVLINCDDQSRLNFVRVKTQVLTNLIKLLPCYIKQDVKVESIFQVLLHDGYLPNIVTGYNNSQFGYIDNNKWIEWNVACISDIRKHWDCILTNVKKDAKCNILQELQKLIVMLPGNKIICTNCLWLVPQNSMHSEYLCCYCVDNLEKKVFTRN